MSYMRAQRRQINQNVLLNNRLSNLTNPHNLVGDINIVRNETVGGNLDVSGDLHVDGDLYATSYYATGNYYLDTYVLIPAGTIVQSAAINEPAGWYNCDGRTLTIEVHPDLFAAIQFAYSNGNFSGQDLSFNIPDMRGRVGVGVGQGASLTNRNLAGTGGEENHVLTVDEMPSHSHTSNATGGNSGGLIRTTGNNTAVTVDGSSVEPDLYAATVALTINNTGSNAAHNNMQPYLVLRYLIKY